jgi:hypothetical protein
MDAETVHQVVRNLRDPMDSSSRIHFTARAIKFITLLFAGKHIDAIDLHCVLLHIAFDAGHFNSNTERKYISMRDVVAHLMIATPTCINYSDVISIGNQFSTEMDNEYHEVSDMKILINAM